MKTFRLFSMAALALMMAACSSEDNALETASPAMPGKLQFTATIAAPSGATTRTVYTEVTESTDPDYNKIKVAWKENDEIAAIVTNSEGKLVKTVLKVSKVNDNGSAVISGDITKPKEDALTVDLIYPASIVTVADDGSNYTISFEKMRDGSTLDGTLDKIAANIDYRMADDCALTVSGDKATLTSAAKLVSKLSIWKLTLLDLTTADELSASQVTIKDGDGVTMVSSAASGSTVYLPVPAASGIDIAISATKGSDTYYYLKKNVTLAAGKYYESEVKMEKPTNLSSISGTEYPVFNGQVLTGALAADATTNIKIADGATVMLKDVTINGTNVNDNAHKHAGITCVGSATIILEGDNTVKGFYENYPGIYVPEDNTLTIMGSGKLTASPFDGGGTYSFGAGIGGGYNISCGNIVISSGTVKATGGNSGAGIGGGQSAGCGTITISGGTVDATGDNNGAGIGGGYKGTCGAITISGGNITAKGSGKNGAGIGGGFIGTCGAITISGGTVTATGAKNAAGIGGGYANSSYAAICGNILIEGGTVEATGGDKASGIGSGNNGGGGASCGTITITSGVTSVKATMGASATNSIGAGPNGSTCGTVTIDGVVNATTSSTFTNFTSSVSGNTWTLTHN